MILVILDPRPSHHIVASFRQRPLSLALVSLALMSLLGWAIRLDGCVSPPSPHQGIPASHYQKKKKGSGSVSEDNVVHSQAGCLWPRLADEASTFTSCVSRDSGSMLSGAADVLRGDARL